MVVVVMEVEATVVVMEAAAMEEVMVVVTEVVMEVVTEVAKDTEEVATEVAKDTEEAAMEVAATVAAKEVMAEDTEVAAMEEVMEEVTVEVMEEATVAVTEVAMEVVVMEADTTVKHSSIIIFTSNAGHLISCLSIPLAMLHRPKLYIPQRAQIKLPCILYFSLGLYFLQIAKKENHCALRPDECSTPVVEFC
ncbi:uncharacterized protein LOC125378840 [Haliotis rufescens]|uniref:uncharacterized protein LOC125378840 n=2 Tax=Haliotis rufescens TaxID=6454 RepID=UPI00201F14C9|nr:uncharacterized protein LOC125378840 [Haliotis rufescens]